jgi:SsrA-binding protein
MEIRNRKANYEYFILDKYECGIELKGTEIKSLRNNSADIKDSFGIIRNNEVFLLNMYIAKYDKGNQFNHDERRTRKLLLHKQEIRKIRKSIEQEGLTLVPIAIYLKGNHAKVELGVCKGKKLYDKREAIKEKDLARELKVKL